MQPGFFKVLILDATYRFFPKGTDENSNAALADIYNQLDAYAGLLGCSFVLVHHASKGNQSGKAVTDVGAGAGSQSRAADTHLVLRPHEETDCVVVDAAVRSWPPIEPRCIRWTFPLWMPDDSLDPADLRPERPKRRSKPVEPARPVTPPEPEWNAQRFTNELAGPKSEPTQALLDRAVATGLSQRKAKLLLRQAEAAGLLHRWTIGPNKPVEYATVPQVLTTPKTR
jgi:hypothetical protein